jgi:hypothetical protein
MREKKRNSTMHQDVQILRSGGEFVLAVRDQEPSDAIYMREVLNTFFATEGLNYCAKCEPTQEDL